jgi:hypothetical protein
VASEIHVPPKAVSRNRHGSRWTGRSEGRLNPAGLIDSLPSRPNPPGARRIAVAVELKSRIVVGAPAPGNRQALPSLHVADLKDAAGVVDPPGARRIAVAVELKSRHVVVGAPAPGNRQALPSLTFLIL